MIVDNNILIEQKNFIEKNKNRLQLLSKKYSNLFYGKDYPIEMFLDYRFLIAYNELWGSDVNNTYDKLAESFLWDLEDAYSNNIYDVMKIKLNQTWTYLSNKYGITIDKLINEGLSSKIDNVADFFKTIFNNVELIIIVVIGLLIINAIKK